MPSENTTVTEMRRVLTLPSDASRDRVRSMKTRQLEDALSEAHVPRLEIDVVAARWEEFRSDDAWVSLLASLVDWVGRTRGDVDAPIPIWDDLDDAGDHGRFFYFYLFAICLDETLTYLRRGGCPPDVIDATMTVMPRHVGVHERKRGTVGFEPGWWLLPILRGEMVQVGSLQFHRVNLGVGNLSPEPWYSTEESIGLGEGFRRGDPSVGIHIPNGADLAPKALDATFARAREVLGEMWPRRPAASGHLSIVAPRRPGDRVPRSHEQHRPVSATLHVARRLVRQRRRDHRLHLSTGRGFPRSATTRHDAATRDRESARARRPLARPTGLVGLRRSLRCQGASMIGRNSRQGPTAAVYCLAIVLKI